MKELKLRKRTTTILILLLVVIEAHTSGCIDQDLHGTYINQNKTENYLQLNTDHTYYVHQTPNTYSGTWYQCKDKIMLNIPFLPTDYPLLILNEGDVLQDMDGEKWIRE